MTQRNNVPFKCVNLVFILFGRNAYQPFTCCLPVISGFHTDILHTESLQNMPEPCDKRNFKSSQTRNYVFAHFCIYIMLRMLRLVVSTGLCASRLQQMNLIFGPVESVRCTAAFIRATLSERTTKIISKNSVQSIAISILNSILPQ